MSKRIKRYIELCEAGIVSFTNNQMSEVLADVAAIEAENVRLAQIVERADTMREWIREHLKPPSHQANLSHNRKRLLDSLAAYDAAKEKKT